MAQWVEEHFYLPQESADKHGLFNFYYTPYLRFICEALDDPEVKEVVCMKAAQVAWTTVLIAYILKRISREPCTIVGMFAKEGDAKAFSEEKLTPTILVTPEANALVDVSTSRKSGNRALFKKFPGGLLKMAGSNSPGSVKSTPAEVVFVEEPDDANVNLKDQGDSISLLWERTKRKKKYKRIMGGTPSIDGLSRVQEHIKQSDERVFEVPCHDCGEYHVLDWENVSWLHDDTGTVNHIVYGTAKPETAVYSCPFCGSVWDDSTRQDNIRNMRCVATSDFHGVAGFKELSELYSCLPGASLKDVVIDYLNAEHKASLGDETARIVFQNSKLGRPYLYKSGDELPENLQDSALDYEEMIIPAGGYIVTAGVDVQHDRLAIIMRAHGPENESWLLYWGEIYAQVSTTDRNDCVWRELDSMLFSDIKSEQGWTTKLSAITIDSSDGHTNDAVYDWVRTRSKKYSRTLIMAGKGSSSQSDPEIFTTPRSRSIDHSRPDKQTKADRHGVKVFQIGTNKAKDFIHGQLKLECNPSAVGFFHFYSGVRSDYFEQITAEVKAPHRNSRGRKVWQKKSGCRNEAIDCEVMALHAARAIRVHLISNDKWGKIAEGLTIPQQDKKQNSPKSRQRKPAVSYANAWKK